MYEFNPNFKVISAFNGYRSIESIEGESGVYSATEAFARKHCGPIVHGILDLVPSAYYDLAKALGLFVNIDVRVHRLYPGDFPAYPGWHCDGEYRETYFSQPDLSRVPVHNHLVTTVSTHPSGVSNTQFLSERLIADVQKPDSEHTLWGQVDQQIRSKLETRSYDAMDGEIVQFDSWTLHRCMPAKVRGWRLFFRMSMWHRANLGDGGKISRQEQVYKLCEGSGW